MDKPSTETHLHERLGTFGLKPEGLKNLRVYHPCNSEAARADSKEFDLPFSDLPPFLISELATLTEPQEGAFLKIVEKLREAQRKKGGKRQPAGKAKSAAIAFLEGDVSEAEGYTIGDVIREIPELEKVPDGTKWPLERKMRSLERAGIFDQGKGYVDPDDMLKAGLVSVIDVSGVANDAAKNLSIAYILRRVFDAKLRHEDSPKTLVLIEEAHTFISREARDKMTTTMDMLKLIARRGRKRWLALAFVSQQPAHLPDEIFELCNTRFIHAIKSDYNLNPVRKTSGDVISELWDVVPGFGPGQCLVSSPQFNHTIMVDMRPCKTKRRMVE